MIPAHNLFHNITGGIMIVKVDKNDCIGCGLCESMCPEVFKMDSNDKAEAITDDIDTKFKENCQQAANDCPAGVIKIIGE